MPWNSGIPQPAQTISETTTPIQDNFLAVQVWTNVDHVQIDGILLGNQGKHNKVTLMNQAAAPPFTPVVVPATGVSALGLYALAGNLPIGTANTTTQLYAHVVRKDAGVNYTTSEVPFSYSVLTRVQAPTYVFAQSNFGYTYLPSGILMKWGTSPASDVVAPASFIVVNANIAAAGPAFTQILSVQITSVQSALGTLYNNVIAVTAITATTFTIQRQDGTSPNAFAPVNTRVNWLCIGY